MSTAWATKISLISTIHATFSCKLYRIASVQEGFRKNMPTKCQLKTYYIHASERDIITICYYYICLPSARIYTQCVLFLDPGNQRVTNTLLNLFSDKISWPRISISHSAFTVKSELGNFQRCNGQDLIIYSSYACNLNSIFSFFYILSDPIKSIFLHFFNI